MNPQKPRRLFADIAKGLGIILVVMEHDHFINTNHTPVQTIILSFHMPLFYFLSGIFFKPQHSFTTHVSARFHSLLKPYFSVCLAFAGLLLLKTHDMGLFLGSAYGIFYGTGRTLHWPYGALWFLPSLFVTTIFYYFIYREILSRFPARWGRISVMVAMLVTGFWVNRFIRNSTYLPDLPWGINLVLITTFFYAAGYEIREYLNRDLSKTKQWGFILAVVAVTGYALLTFSGKAPVLNFFYRRYDSLFLNTAQALAAIYIIVFSSILIEKKSRLFGGAIAFVGQRSLTVFMFHSFFLPYITGFLLNYAHFEDGIGRFVLSVSITIVFCLFVHEILSRLPIFSFLILNKRRNC